MVLLLPVVALVVALVGLLDRDGLSDGLRIAGGSAGGTYLAIGTGLQSVLEGGPVEGERVDLLETRGSTENATLVEDREALLGFVQNNAAGSNSLRTLARLYDEVFQVVARADQGIRGIGDLDGKAVYLGPKDSGTEQMARRVLGHYGVRVETPEIVATDDLEGALETGEIQAAFFLAGVPTKIVGELLRSRDLQLLNLGEPGEAGSSLAGIAATVPGTRPSVVPAHIYGSRPDRAVGTLAVEALLVTHAQTSNASARRLTQELFENRFELIRAHSAMAQMREIEDSRGLRFALHPGAASYYARNEPPFLVLYAETLSLAVTLLVSLISGLFAARHMGRRNKKNRVDVYYLELEELSRRIRQAQQPDALRALRSDLLDLRHRAFKDLVAEKLRPDQAFSILQDSVNHRLADITQQLR